MVKSVLGVNHQGLRDWLFQRVTAIIMALYTLGLAAFFMMHTHPDFNDVHVLFSPVWMKVATLLAILSLLYHAWIGMWIVLTDYIKIFSLRLILQVAVILALVTYALWSLEILWGM